MSLQTHLATNDFEKKNMFLNRYPPKDFRLVKRSHPTQGMTFSPRSSQQNSKTDSF